MPSISREGAREQWLEFFSKHRPYPLRIRQWVMKLHRQKEHRIVIGCLEAALIQGQTQPWMYEVLALSMELENYPREQIERVVLSLSDFGSVNFESLMYSAAYLTRFDRKAMALKLYQQAAQLAPERHEPYVLGLKLAEDVGDVNDVAWAATGILQHSWGTDYRRQQRLAEDALLTQLTKLRRAGETEAMQELTNRLTAAKSRDLEVRVEWSGAGDLDLQVEEPSGAICSYENPLTVGGGIFLHDGAGPDQADCYESYVCPQGFSGPYRLRVVKAFGDVVGNRAVVTVTKYAGTDREESWQRTLVLDNGEATLLVELEQGRRTQPRALSFAWPADHATVIGQRVQPVSAEQPIPARQLRGPQRFQNLQRQTGQQRLVRDAFENDRSVTGQRTAGAVTYGPVVDVMGEGATMSARAVISPDRRYVRIAVQPTFSTITDVFTFSIINGGTP